MDLWFAMFGLFFFATLVAMFFGAYLTAELGGFPDEYRKAGSPSAFWNNWRSWSFLSYVLRGGFEDIPDASLVAKFKVYRGLEASRLLLAVGLVLAGLGHDIFLRAAH